MTRTDSEDNKSPVYNILLLGQTQAGKSTFLQGVRRYADPTCEVDTLSIGNGNQSHTTNVDMQEVETTFPRHLVYEIDDDQEEQKSYFSLFRPSQLLSYIPFMSERFGSARRINVESLISNCTIQEYRAKIERTEGLEIRQVEQYSHHRCTIRVFDTPGLEDTNYQDERNVAAILTSLSKENDIHLVLIVISRYTPLTPGLKEALETYSNIFSAMNGLMAVIHTHFKYRDQHSDDRNPVAFIKERKADLDAIMGRGMTHFLLDCDLDEDLPIHIYLRQRTIREILLMATFNIPVPLNTMQLYKTKKMREVDMLIQREQTKDKTALEEKYRIVDKAIDLDMKINDARYNIRELSEFIRNNDTDVKELMAEKRYEEGWGLFSSRKEEELRCSDLPFNIDHMQVHTEGVEILHESGGKGGRHWYIKIKRGWFQHGVYHAKLYVEQRNKMRQQILHKRSELERLERMKDNLVSERSRMDSLVPPESGTLKIREDLKKKQEKCLDMIMRASRPTLHLNLFNRLVRDKMYEGTLLECVDKVVDFYSQYTPAADEEVTF